MRLTKSQIKRIIREERHRINSLKTIVRNSLNENTGEWYSKKPDPFDDLVENDPRRKLMMDMDKFLDIPFMSTTESWDDTPGGIWMSGEAGGVPQYKNKKDRYGEPIRVFDYYSEDYKNYDIGVYIPFEKWLKTYGFYGEWYDAGTIFLYPINFEQTYQGIELS